MTMSKPSGFAEVNGARLYYETTGTGEPVIFLHGNTLDARMWDDQFLVFAQQYQAIRYDLRGFGKSSPPNAEPFAHADDLNGDGRVGDILDSEIGAILHINGRVAHHDGDVRVAIVAFSSAAQAGET